MNLHISSTNEYLPGIFSSYVVFSVSIMLQFEVLLASGCSNLSPEGLNFLVHIIGEGH
jgi:hypothetical protein